MLIILYKTSRGCEFGKTHVSKWLIASRFFRGFVGLVRIFLDFDKPILNKIGEKKDLKNLIFICFLLFFLNRHFGAVVPKLKYLAGESRFYKIFFCKIQFLTTFNKKNTQKMGLNRLFAIFGYFCSDFGNWEQTTTQNWNTSCEKWLKFKFSCPTYPI